MQLLRDRARIAQAYRHPAYLLVAIGLGLITVHLWLSWRLMGSLDQVSLEMIGWTALLYCLWRKRHTVVLNSGIGSQFIGWFLIALIIVRSLNIQSQTPPIAGITSLAIGIGMGLLAFGIRQFRHYIPEILILLLISLPLTEWINPLDRVLHVSLWTAKYAHALMWYLGFPIQRQGIQLVLPTGSVAVYPGCSGLDAALISLEVALFFLITFPTHWRDKLLIPIIAITSAFAVNGFRIMLLAHLTAAKNPAAFEYWHSGGGSQVFAMTSMSLFSSYCQYLLQREESASELADSEGSPAPHDQLESTPTA